MGSWTLTNIFHLSHNDKSVVHPFPIGQCPAFPSEWCLTKHAYECIKIINTSPSVTHMIYFFRKTYKYLIFSEVKLQCQLQPSVYVTMLAKVCFITLILQISVKIAAKFNLKALFIGEYPRKLIYLTNIANFTSVIGFAYCVTTYQPLICSCRGMHVNDTCPVAAWMTQMSSYASVKSILILYGATQKGRLHTKCDIRNHASQSRGISKKNWVFFTINKNYFNLLTYSYPNFADIFHTCWVSNLQPSTKYNKMHMKHPLIGQCFI